MLHQDWQGFRAWDRWWLYERAHPEKEPIMFRNHPMIDCWWPYGWRIVIAFDFPAILATGGTSLSCATLGVVGTRLERHVRPFLLVPILCGILLAAVWLQWWLVGKWLDRVRLATSKHGSRSARFWAAAFLVGPILMWLAYWTPIAQHILTSGMLAMLLLWLFLLVYIPVTWKKGRDTARLSGAG
jgi:hypothetical protein